MNRTVGSLPKCRRDSRPRKKEKEIELLRKQQSLDASELRRRQAARQVLSIGLLLLVPVVLLAYNRYRLGVRAAKTIARQNRELEGSLAELRESEQRYRRLFDDPSLARLLVDPANGDVLAANESAAELVGVSESEDREQGDSSPGRGGLRAVLSRLDGAGVATEGGHCVETIQFGEGQARCFEARASRIRLDDENAALITLHDVTERRQLEEERLRRKERERYIAELETRQAEVEARSLEKERFAYTVSHDLKTPLVTIRGFLGLVEKDMANDEMQRIHQDIGRIDAAAKKLRRLLEELLDLSRIGRTIKVPVEVPLAELARRAVIEAAEAGIDVQVSADLPVVLGDPTRLLEVFRQLIDNAVKFMGHQAAPLIEVGCHRQGQETVLYVRDNGRGIAPPYHGKVFGLFEQLDPEVPGTGIGLALVERAIGAHGGRVWVESEGHGRGSMFCFTFGQARGERPSHFPGGQSAGGWT